MNYLDGDVASWLSAYVQTHQFVPFKSVQFFVYQEYLNKTVKRLE